MTYQATPSTYYAGDGTHALLELKAKCEALLLGWLAYRAGRNYYNLHPNVEDAFIHGAHALRRWWVWLFFVKVWLFSAAFILWAFYIRLHDNAASDYNDVILSDNVGMFDRVIRNGLIFILPALAAVLVTYCRNVDYSLFKRRFVYRIVSPLVKLIDRVPNWVLYLTVPCVLCFPF